MKSRLVMLILVISSMLPLQAFAGKSYYFTVTGTAGGRSTATWGPFASLSECQEALAKMSERNLRKDQSVSSCFAK